MRRQAGCDASVVPSSSGTTGSTASNKRRRLDALALDAMISEDRSFDAFARAGWAQCICSRWMGTVLDAVSYYTGPSITTTDMPVLMGHFRQSEIDHTDSESDSDGEDEHSTTGRIPDLVDIESD